MFPQYIDRLRVIREMLESPLQELVQEAYDLLFDLWLEYLDNTDFCYNLMEIAKEHPRMAQEFTNQINKMPYNKKEKAILLRKSLKFSFQTPKKTGILKPKFITPKIFISYSHKDEIYKDELVTMLAGLQRQGSIDAWQDRRIEAGDEWFDSIQKAMEECDVAVLLISPDFIASRFIQEIELNHFFQQRIEKGLRVIPIIIRSCLWQDEPVIKDLQVFPKDGKSVISYSQNNGDRDQVWADIGKGIESIAKDLR